MFALNIQFFLSFISYIIIIWSYDSVWYHFLKNIIFKTLKVQQINRIHQNEIRKQQQ